MKKVVLFGKSSFNVTVCRHVWKKNLIMCSNKKSAHLFWVMNMQRGWTYDLIIYGMCSFSKFPGFISGMIAGPIYNNGANGSSSDTWPTAEMQGRSEHIGTYQFNCCTFNGSSALE